MMKFKLSDIDPEDIEFAIGKVEKSLGITLIQSDVDDIITFGDLCEKIEEKCIARELSTDCTSQQAYYKLRLALVSIGTSDKINRRKKISNLFLDNHSASVRVVEKEVGFALNIQQIPEKLTSLIIMFFVLGVVFLFSSWPWGIVLILVSALSYLISLKCFSVIKEMNVEELIQSMVRDNYILCRRNPNSINPKEIRKIILDNFTYHLALSEANLQPQEKLFN